MNTKILQKCLEELKKETPDLSYLRGTLETLIEISGGVEVPKNFTVTTPTMFSSTQISVNDLPDEEKEYHARMAGGPIAPMRDSE